jgi:hypothetical protein
MKVVYLAMEQAAKRLVHADQQFGSPPNQLMMPYKDRLTEIFLGRFTRIVLQSPRNSDSLVLSLSVLHCTALKINGYRKYLHPWFRSRLLAGEKLRRLLGHLRKKDFFFDQGFPGRNGPVMQAFGHHAVFGDEQL